MAVSAGLRKEDWSVGVVDDAAESPADLNRRYI